MEETIYRVALLGNPNVGKSTVFNTLTGMKQHTGNWTGKTVEISSGRCKIGERIFLFTDLPGTYSLQSYSEEETVTENYLRSHPSECVLIVLDSNALQRNLSLALEALSITQNAVICLNMTDEAKRNGIIIDEKALSRILGVPVVKTSASRKKGINNLKSVLLSRCEGKIPCRKTELLCDIEADSGDSCSLQKEYLSSKAKEIYRQCVSESKSQKGLKQTLRADKILTSKLGGTVITLLLCGLLFWLTLVGANYPSEWLAALFSYVKELLISAAKAVHLPEVIKGILIDGIYTTLSWVVAVMLPPMAIFFPLFAIIEDSGYLPRIAFNADRVFSKCGSGGKQCLTMMMGIGCNACGIEGCRIIENRGERLIAILTNNLMPCNGRFPILIAVISVFFAGTAMSFSSSLKAMAILLAVIVICVCMTLLLSKAISKTLVKDSRSGFALELPPYRKPQLFHTLVRSFLDKTLAVLGRAVIVAAPAGAVIWLLANICIDDKSLLLYCTDFLDPFGKFIGLDGVILMAFLLGFPANETVIPIIIMSYTAGGKLTDYAGYEQLSGILTQNGWTALTAVCMMIMTVMHFPCSTTCFTIKKETGSFKWTFLSMAIPTVMGIALCAVTANIWRLCQ